MTEITKDDWVKIELDDGSCIEMRAEYEDENEGKVCIVNQRTGEFEMYSRDRVVDVTKDSLDFLS